MPGLVTKITKAFAISNYIKNKCLKVVAYDQSRVLIVLEVT